MLNIIPSLHMSYGLLSSQIMTKCLLLCDAPPDILPHCLGYVQPKCTSNHIQPFPFNHIDTDCRFIAK